MAVVTRSVSTYTPAATRYRNVARMAAYALLCYCSSLSAQPVENPQSWLKKMVHAARTLNYDGTFVYQSRNRTESMRIIHRNDVSGVRERLVSLTGVAREVLRDNGYVTCILPDNASVMTSPRRPPAVNRSPLFEVASVPQFYALKMLGLDRVAGRVAERLELKPQDDFRYGMRLWIDRQSGLLLRNDLLHPAHGVLESVAYTSISMPEQISDELLKPGISGDGFRRITWPEREQAIAPSASEASWYVRWVPEGFALRRQGLQQRAGDEAAAEHLVYSDGLASVSVFIEALPADANLLKGHSSMGAASAYGRMIGVHQVTVVGEVPAATVERIGLSVKAR